MHAVRQLLASDLDGTLIPPVVGGEAVRAIGRLASAKRSTPELALAYVTGRHFALAERGIVEWSLPAPDYLVCDVGTSVYRRTASGLELDDAYAETMRAAMRGTTASELRSVLAALPFLVLQEEERQTEYKASWFAPDADIAGIVQRVEESLSRSDMRASVVVSRDAGKSRLLVDVLPESVAKDTAIRFLHSELGLPDEKTVYAGDSGNDRAVMLSGIQSVLVSNAPQALKDDLHRAARERGLDSQIFFATRPYASGVLQGCEHFGLL